MSDVSETSKNTIVARDINLLWPLLLATVFIMCFFAFLFYVFSGRVDLKDATVSALVGAAITQIVNAMSIVITHYFKDGKDKLKAYNQQDKE